MKYTFALALAVTLAASPLARAQLDHPHRVLGRGVSLVVDGKFSEAEHWLRDAIRLDANMPEAHYNLGVVLRNTGRYDEAIVEYRRAMQLFQQYGAADGENALSRCLYAIALANEDKGDPLQATIAWNDFLRYARRFRAEHPAVEIAQRRLADDQRLAQIRTSPGVQKATRPSNVR
jgi:tetratricopeptide (TPR) repeat protein